MRIRKNNRPETYTLTACFFGESRFTCTSQTRLFMGKFCDGTGSEPLVRTGPGSKVPRPRKLPGPCEWLLKPLS